MGTAEHMKTFADQHVRFHTPDNPSGRWMTSSQILSAFRDWALRRNLHLHDADGDNRSMGNVLGKKLNVWRAAQVKGLTKEQRRAFPTCIVEDEHHYKKYYVSITDSAPPVVPQRPASGAPIPDDGAVPVRPIPDGILILKDLTEADFDDFPRRILEQLEEANAHHVGIAMIKVPDTMMSDIQGRLKDQINATVSKLILEYMTLSV
jgi:hypothetical protein